MSETKKSGIFYFSSTGNSLDISRKLQMHLGGQIHYIPNFDGSIDDYENIIIVSPVYSFGLPIPVESFISNIDSDSPCYIVLNYGGFAFSAPYYAYQFAKKHHLNIKAIHKVKMPENFTLMFSPPESNIVKSLKKSIKAIESVALKIENGETNEPKKPLLNLEKSHAKNKKNWFRLASDFSVDSSCINCKKCIVICPTKNIEEVDSKITFSNSCVACLGCYHRCPTKSINYKNKTKSKSRYINPNIDQNMIK